MRHVAAAVDKKGCDMWGNGWYREAIRHDHIYLPKGGTRLGALAPKEQKLLRLHFNGLGLMHQF